MSDVEVLQIRREEWMERGACVRLPVDTCFPHSVREQARVAVEVCGPCPVRAECLAQALGSSTVVEGVWGGTTEADRRAIRKHTKTSAEEASA